MTDALTYHVERRSGKKSEVRDVDGVANKASETAPSIVASLEGLHHSSRRPRGTRAASIRDAMQLINNSCE